MIGFGASRTEWEERKQNGRGGDSSLAVAGSRCVLLFAVLLRAPFAHSCLAAKLHTSTSTCSIHSSLYFSDGFVGVFSLTCLFDLRFLGDSKGKEKERRGGNGYLNK